VNLRGLVAASLVATRVVFFAPAPRASAAPCAVSSSAFAGVTVAVVVDFGDGSPVSAVCVPADSSDNGAAVLAARAEQLGTPAPRFDSSGFVCGIDGYPSSGCGEQDGSTYAYWSYWHGTGGGGWQYSNVGPGGSRVHADVVEGWRFQPKGAGNPGDPPPNGSPDHNATCVPATATTVAAAPETTVVAPALAETTTTRPTSTGSSSSTSQVAGAPARATNRGSGSSSSPWPAIGAGVVIVGLVGGGVFAARRRGESP